MISLFRSALFPAACGALAVALTAAPKHAAACGYDSYIGQICLMATPFCPKDTVEAQGQILEINKYQALYSIVGSTYGGDAHTKFGVPDFRGRIPVGWGQGEHMTTHAMGQMFGAEGVRQTTGMMAQHTHAAVFTPDGAGTLSVSVAIPVAAGPGTTNTPGRVAVPAQVPDIDLSSAGGSNVPVYVYSTAPPDTVLKPFYATVNGPSVKDSTVTVAASGGSQPLPTVPPEIALRFCVVTTGLYPQRP